MNIIDLNDIKSRIEKMSCPTHGKHPVVTINPDGVNLSCCCGDFKHQLTDKVKQLAGEQVSRYVKDRLFR